LKILQCIPRLIFRNRQAWQADPTAIAAQWQAVYTRRGILADSAT
jgi:hypothetical protein